MIYKNYLKLFIIANIIFGANPYTSSVNCMELDGNIDLSNLQFTTK